MFCRNCGHEIADGVKFCTHCGAKVESSFDQTVNNVVNGAQGVFNQAEKQLHSAVKDVQDSFQSYKNDGYRQTPPPNAGGSNYGQGGSGRYFEYLQEDRSLLMYILLSIVTCGIYGYYFLYKMAHDVNIACAGDGDNTTGLIGFIVLSFFTCGIYSWVWYYKIGNRLQANAPRYGMNFQENGTTILMWLIFGTWLCWIGNIIATYILIHNTNAICIAYNRYNQS